MKMDIKGKTVSELRLLNEHGLVKTREIPEYSIWSGMKYRCNNPNAVVYHNYGGRGIKVCPEWEKDFWTFLEDVGRRPKPSLTLERIDNDGDYAPGNVRWASYYEQNINKRASKLSPEQIDDIRAMRGIKSQSSIAFDYDIATSLVSAIQLGQIHNPNGDVEIPPKLRSGGDAGGKLTEDEVGWIKFWLWLGRYSQSEIARAYGVSPSTIYWIAAGRTWPNIPMHDPEDRPLDDQPFNPFERKPELKRRAL